MREIATTREKTPMSRNDTIFVICETNYSSYSKKDFYEPVDEIEACHSCAGRNTFLRTVDSR